ncbi:MAG: prepilin-type N-terminal cleavage/methylation domain-containing protein [Rhodocyclaceae bacterium]
MNRGQSGFTLVEIAIVLVIIGLLLGGILKGQELITQARIKNVVNDMNGVSTAIYSYQDRYRALPGDDKLACSRWSASRNGNGDGSIQQAADTVATGCDSGVTLGSDADANKENRVFWQHLRLAGLVAGDSSNSDEPLNASGGKLRVFNGPFGLSGLYICATGLPAKVASAIDSQFDDGLPNKGSVRGDDKDPATGASTLTAYLDDPSKTYSVCKAF